MAYTAEAVATILALLAASFAYHLVQNIIKARAMGLPVVFVPVDQAHLLWVIVGPHLRRPLERILPASLWRRLSLSIFGWEFHEGLRPFERLAPAGRSTHKASPAAGHSFALVGLRSLEVWTADPVAAQDIILRTRDFEIPHAHAYALGPYGPNVLSTNGDRWALHRKIITGVIDERISRAVFEESSQQVSGLLDEVFAPWEPGSLACETEALFDMLKSVTIHVLLSVSMGARAPWKSRHELATPEPGYTMSHISSLVTMVTNLVGVGLLPVKLLDSWPRWLPWHDLMTTVGRAKAEVYRRSKSILNSERKRRRTSAMEAEGDGKHKANIMSKLLRASESGDSYALTEDEMISNLFAVTAAGFETTATSLAYAVVLLARYPLWQDWLLEEIDQLSPIPYTAGPQQTEGNDAADGSSPARADYNTVFPRATRVLAFMFETLRLYSPVPHVHRETEAPQELRTASGRIAVIPAGVRINVNSVALHLLPCWRDVNRQSDPPFVEQSRPGGDGKALQDEHVFRPSRWLNPPGSAQRLYHPPKGTWAPWSMGARVCPGQKMAQVEFAAVLLALLRDHRVEAVPLAGEEPGQTQARLDGRLRDSRWVTVLQMNGVFDQNEGEGLAMRLAKRH
ncbi:hypothetical protein RB595_000161 [Gaeumannomyces hyphopodioides]